MFTIINEIGAQCSDEELENIRSQLADTITFETILRPSVTCDLSQGHLVDVSCRFEVATTDDGLHYYLRPQFSFIDEHVRFGEEMDDVTQEEYDEYCF